MGNRTTLRCETVELVVYCRYCHKTHGVNLDETPCAPGAWHDEATGLSFERVKELRDEQ